MPGASGGGGRSLDTIDLETGAPAQIGSTNLDQVLSMTYVPGPTTAATAALTGGRRRRV